MNTEFPGSNCVYYHTENICSSAVFWIFNKRLISESINTKVTYTYKYNLYLRYIFRSCSKTVTFSIMLHNHKTK